MPITPLPALDRTSATFRTDVDLFFASQLPAFGTEFNALQVDVTAKQALATTAAETATTKAGEALASASSATLSKTNADSARDAALVAQAAAEAALDSFDDRYLGAKAVAPLVDNDGAALITGAIYFDTALGGGSWRAWNGSAWVTAPAANASAVTNTPSGSIAATNVQAAIDELAAEKAASGANTDITSLGAVTGVTAALADNTTKLATTAFVIANAPVVPSASETVQGKIEIADAAEAIAGTDTVRAITPAGLRSGLNASGTAPVYACRAWVNFNGTGTVAIRASGNVSSITDNGVGDYTVNFATAMTNENYCANVTTDRGSPARFASTADVTAARTSTILRISISDTSSNAVDSSNVGVAIFR